MSAKYSGRIHDPNHTVEEYDIYFNGDIISGSGDHELSANIHDPNHTVEEYDIYFNGELIESGRGSSDMNGWTDGVPYTDIEIVNNECVGLDGSFKEFYGWNRTGYIPCNGASRISIPGDLDRESPYNAFYDENHKYIRSITIHSGEEYEDIAVPTDAYFFALSEGTNRLKYILDTGVIPHA